MVNVRVVNPDEALRLAEIGELTALAYLADSLVDSAHPYVPHLRNAAARAEHATLLMVAEGEDGRGAAAGTLTVVPAGTKFSELATGSEYELRMLAVSPLARGRGIGEMLTRAGMALAVERGASRIVLSTMETMTAAHRLYDRLGFVRQEALDWVVFDSEDGEVVKQRPAEAAVSPACATPGVTLLGYAWEPAH